MGFGIGVRYRAIQTSMELATEFRYGGRKSSEPASVGTPHGAI